MILLPHNLEAEQSLLGAILFDNQTIERIGDLTPEHFYDPVHGRIFAACAQIIRAGQLADGVTLRERFTRDGGLTEIGGASYLLKLIESGGVLTAHAQQYAEMVRDLAMRRAILRAGQEVTLLAANPPDDMDGADILGEAQRAFDGIAGSSNAGVPLQSFGQAAETFLASLDSGGARAIPTGYESLDYRLGGGLFRGDLVIMCGRPSMGKTAMADNIELNMGKAGFRCGSFSQEMKASALVMRAISAASYHQPYKFDRIPYSALRNGAPNVDRVKLREFAGTLKELPVLIDDRSGLSVQQIEWSARAMRKILGGLDCIFIDYLQILSRPARGGRNDAAIIQEMTQGLKAMARNMDIAIVALSQLSRAVESRDDKRPNLSDLRESGAIEQDADVVMALYREAYYLERREPPANASTDKLIEWQTQLDRVRDQIEVITLKQRQGPIGTDTLRTSIEHDVILDAPQARSVRR